MVDHAPLETAVSPHVVTFGCRLNAVESEVMRAHASAAGDPDLVVINTCAVTTEAERQARQHIRKIKRANPQARVVVTGCAAQINPQAWARMPEVSRVLGNIEKLNPQNFLKTEDLRVDVGDIMLVRETAQHMLAGFSDRVRAFVEIQQGCDHRCTFCIIPFARGNARSVPAGLVVERIQKLMDHGYKEIVLTGVDITSYGTDLPGTPSLGGLVQRILKLVPDLPRLRLSSVDSVEIDAALVDAITSEQRIMPHLHLSLQHGDNLILKRMKRRHQREDAIRFCQDMRARRPDIVFGADLIAGFPTEDEAMFENNLSLVDACGLTLLHVFPFAARPGTPAEKMPQVPMPIRKERARRLRNKGNAVYEQYLTHHLGQVSEVLIETEQGHGHTPHFIPVRVEGQNPVGSCVRVITTGHSQNHFLARRL